MSWIPTDGTIDDVMAKCPRPLATLAAAELPAVIIRSVLSVEQCQTVVQRLHERDLIYDHRQPMPDRFRERCIPEGYYRTANATPTGATPTETQPGGRRIDVGTSLGYRGASQDSFFQHAKESQRLFSRLFEGICDPVKVLYRTMSALAAHQEVITAHEPDGRNYGPAIFRAHYGRYSYPPHFDSVRYRERREGYAVNAYDHQFACVIVLQNAVARDTTAQCAIYNRLWQPELDTVLANRTFHDYAASHQIESCRVILQPGDFYVFNTRCIHEVPGVDGELPRIVLAAFAGYSADVPKIMIWG